MMAIRITEDFDVLEVFEKDGLLYLKSSGNLFSGLREIRGYCNDGEDINYKNGKKDGKYFWWDDDGFTIEEGSYKNGKQDGICRCYYSSSSSIACEILYDKGFEVSKRYYER